MIYVTCLLSSVRGEVVSPARPSKLCIRVVLHSYLLEGASGGQFRIFGNFEGRKVGKAERVQGMAGAGVARQPQLP